MRVAFLIAMSALTTGCSQLGVVPTASSSTQVTTPAFQNSSDTNAMAAMEARLATRSNTAWAAMPVQGGATFTGFAAVTIGNSAPETALIGNATISMDFQNAAMAGSLSGFSGQDANNDFAAYAGAISISNGTIGQSEPNALNAQYSGNLSGNGDVIGLAGSLQGRLKADPIVGMFLDDPNAVAVLNGSNHASTIRVIAEID